MSARSPVVVCRTSELTEAGAFYTADAASVPILVVRDARGTIRAFVNLCRHRGARLVHEKTGVTRTFTCLLHGWTYDAEGQMGGAPLARIARDNPMLAAIRDTSALFPLPLEVRHGFAWVVPATNAAIDVGSFLGPLDAELAGVEHYVVRERGPVDAPSASARVVSDDVAFDLGSDAVTVFQRLERRAETDFGERTSEGAPPETMLERLVLVRP